jgi:hypothetical protein
MVIQGSEVEGRGGMGDGAALVPSTVEWALEEEGTWGVTAAEMAADVGVSYALTMDSGIGHVRRL